METGPDMGSPRFLGVFHAGGPAHSQGHPDAPGWRFITGKHKIVHQEEKMTAFETMQVTLSDN